MNASGKIILAIDPGAGGGIAWGEEAGGPASSRPMPDTEGGVVESLRWILAAAGGSERVSAYVEQVGGFVKTAGGQPGSAMFKFGRGYGFLLGACAALCVPVELVTPQRWQKGMAAGVRSDGNLIVELRTGNLTARLRELGKESAKHPHQQLEAVPVGFHGLVCCPSHQIALRDFPKRK